MTTQCLSCSSLNSYRSTLLGQQCRFCSFGSYVWLCTTCSTNPVHTCDGDCEPCEDHKMTQKVLIAENVPLTEAPPRKVSGFTRLPDRFDIKERVFVKDKFRAEKKAKRRDRKARDNFRRIKMDYDTRPDLGNIDKMGNFSYEGRFYGWGTMFGIVPLTKRERENANRTNGHLVPTSPVCKCMRWMWTKSHPHLKAGHMHIMNTCRSCPDYYKLDKYGHTEIDYYTGEDMTESPVVRW